MIVAMVVMVAAVAVVHTVLDMAIWQTNEKEEEAMTEGAHTIAGKYAFHFFLHSFLSPMSPPLK